jgi:hypothetical protein
MSLKAYLQNFLLNAAEHGMICVVVHYYLFKKKNPKKSLKS